MGIASELIIIFLLIILNGCLAMSELAVVSARKSLLKKKADEGSNRAKAALLLSEDTGRFLPTVQIGITLIGILAGAFSGATISEQLGIYFADHFGLSKVASTSIAITIVVIMITYLTLIIGELVPKRLALRYPEVIAMLLAPFLDIIARITSPIVTFLEFSSNIILKLFGINANYKHTVTEEEVKALITEGSEAGILKPQEKEMIMGVMRLADKPVKNFMTPRVKVEWIDIQDELGTIKDKISNSCYSRFVVCDNSIENVLGIVQSKDIVAQLLGGHNLNLKLLITKVPFFGNNTAALKIIDFLKESPVHLAVIVDEYGGLEGIITAADFLEAIVGDIGENKVSNENNIVSTENGSWIIDGETSIDLVINTLEIGKAYEGDYNTLAGFIISHLDHIPNVGESFEWEGFKFSITSTSLNKIDKVSVTKN